MQHNVSKTKWVCKKYLYLVVRSPSKRILISIQIIVVNTMQRTNLWLDAQEGGNTLAHQDQTLDMTVWCLINANYYFSGRRRSRR
jgi:hypothetical protein